MSHSAAGLALTVCFAFYAVLFILYLVTAMKVNTSDPANKISPIPFREWSRLKRTHKQLYPRSALPDLFLVSVVSMLMLSAIVAIFRFGA